MIASELVQRVRISFIVAGTSKMSIQRSQVYNTLASFKKNLKRRKPYFLDDGSYLEYLRRTRTNKEEFRERICIAEYLIGKR